ncbi:MAG: DUF4160 domain-containing protein [Acidobacteriota bacterium]
MPVISMLYGIIVQLYFSDNDRHNLPHIHIRYSEYNASIAIETGEILAGIFQTDNLNWFRLGLKFTKTN